MITEERLEQIRASNAKRKANNKKWNSFSRKKAAANRPFIGVDGEGIGDGKTEPQRYALLRAGDEYIVNQDGLSTYQCLKFLAWLPTKNRIYVGFWFKYDVAMILKDLPREKIAELLERKVRRPDEEQSKDTIYWHCFEIGYFPGKHFKVRMLDATNKPVTDFITIHDVGSFFQGRFDTIIVSWDISPEDRQKITEGKNARGGEQFNTVDDKMIEYNRLECKNLAELMTAFRKVCQDCGYVPRAWEGPGQLAAAMLKAHNIPKGEKIAELVPAPLWRAANNAYYGGRFEVFKVGMVPKVYEHDISSAYPSAYLSLPCLECAHWEKTDRIMWGRIFLARVRYSHAGGDERIVCNLPFRTDKGILVWPRQGQGWFWSIELEQAVNAGTEIEEVFEVWEYHSECNHAPFGDWVRDVYQKRRDLVAAAKLELRAAHPDWSDKQVDARADTRGIPIKLALNSIYGKICQSIGMAPFANPIWGGLITAHTRSMLIKGYRELDPSRLVMLATDGLYSVDKCDGCQPVGKALGFWEQSPAADDLFVVKPGMYGLENGKKVKTRGLRRELFLQGYDGMKKLFELWLGTCYQSDIAFTPEDFGIQDEVKDGWPFRLFFPTMFVGLRLGMHLKKYQLGQWANRPTRHSFDPTSKRRPGNKVGGHIETFAKPGSPDAVSEEYRRPIGGIPNEAIAAVMADLVKLDDFEERKRHELAEMLLEDLPDSEYFSADDEIDPPSGVN